jgi:chromate transport protein ChrA
LHGLKLAVVAVVALAVWSMAGSMWTDRRRTTLGKLVAVFMLLMPGAMWQITVIVVGGLAGFALFRGSSPSSESQSKASSRGREDINVFETSIDLDHPCSAADTLYSLCSNLKRSMQAT